MNELPKIYAIASIGEMIFIVPILMVFLRKMGLSLFELLLLQTIYSITLTIFEFPSGVFADLFGRKKALLIFFSLWIFGLSIYCLGTTFQMFAIAESLLGIGTAFLSGTLTALVYDILKEYGRVGEATKIFGNIQALTIYSSLTAFIIGGFIATIDLRLPFWFTLITFLIGTAICSTLREPRLESKVPNYTSFIVHVKKSIDTLRNDLHLSILIFITAFLGCLFTVSFWIWQPYLQDIGVSIEFFGIIYGVNSITTALAANLAYKIELLLDEKKLLVIFPTILSFSFIGLGLCPPIIIAIILIQLQQITKGVLNPILTKYINMLTQSEIRATIFSLLGLLTRLQFAILSPFIGFLADTTSLTFALIVCGIFVLIVPILYFSPNIKLANKLKILCNTYHQK